ncbi:NACHT and WD repeat domain-containing protein 2-like [Saccostrea echinata]|uniref:NACHT and WD repeat domain-containing protein 2-like n=1 Tax=Saccostrea echinata TaxID=191078 RepID=UPI002A815AB4|nr:NACHT and WD repeat domain-containing protein 2-like [Saccostrea echinata]
MDEVTKKLLSGHTRIEQIPEIPARTVRIFLNFAAEDSVTERNAIAEKVYPELRDYCRQKYGVEFQLVDLDWGSDPNCVNLDQTFYDFRLRELRRCQILSAGPSFLAFIGQRYGKACLQSSIPAEEFELLRMWLHNQKSRDTRTAPLLDDWYTKDYNSLPPVYFLKDAGKGIPALFSKDHSEFNEGLEKWREIEEEMMRLLHKAADACYLQGLIDEGIKQKYVLSATDNLMVMGIDELSSPQNRCLIAFREIADLKNYVDDPLAKKYADIYYNERTEQFEIDPVSTHLIKTMSERCTKLVTAKNTTFYSVLWRYDDVISPKHHKEYLTNLCSDLSSALKELIDREVPKVVVDEKDELYDECHQHWLRCKHISADFFGRDLEYGKLVEYLRGETNQPMVIHGPAGVGKTSLMSKVASQVHDIMAADNICIIKYVGYTPKSTDIRNLLTSVCTQILVGLKRDHASVTRDFKELQKFFLSLLQSIPENKTLVLFFDAIERILPDHNAHLLTWLPQSLKSNVKIVLSVNTGDNAIAQKLCNDGTKSSQYYVDLKPLSVTEADGLLCYYLSRYGRTLSKQQRSAFTNIFQKCSQPLFVSLCAEKCKCIHSSDSIDTADFCTNFDDAISAMFTALEKMHGYELVSRSMSYLVGSVTGLSDCEMEDLLSLDDSVTSTVYTNHKPSLWRIPHSKWLRLKDDIDRFLVQREVDGVTVYRWKDEQFDQNVKARYLSDESKSKEIYSLIADYYLGIWHGKPKPLSNNGKQTKSQSFDRQVPSQPLTFDCNGQVRFNRRKYDQVPRHLYNAERLEELNRLVLFNYEWIYNKIKALSLQHIIADFALNPSNEASLVEEALRVAEQVIEKDIDNMASEISGHLLPYYQSHPNIRALVHQCDTAGLKQCALIPNFPYLQIPGSSLQFALQCCAPMEYFSLIGDERLLLTKERESSFVHIFDVVLGEKKSSVFASNGALYVTPNGRYFIIVDHVTEKAVKVHNADSGAYIGQLIVLNHIELKPKEKYKLGSICLTNDRVCAIVSTDISYLCIANIETCQFLQIIGLDGKCDVCTISHDGKYVFCNSNEFLFTYNLYTLELLSTFSIGFRPSCIIVSKDGLRAYLTNNIETKLMILHLNHGKVEMAYKSVLDKYMPEDTIMDLRVSPKDDMVLVRGLNNIVVYNRSKEKVLASFKRPVDVPKEFKLPRSHYIDLFFTNAEFTHGGKFVIATIFRNIYLWNVATNELVTTIQAPVGIVKEMLYSPKRSLLITHIEHCHEIQVWNLDDAVKPVNLLDKLTGPISDIQLTQDGETAYVMCKGSDEIGVIEMRSGIMVDLLTHESPVVNFAITPSGDYALVSLEPKKKDICTKLWNLQERQVIKEFGNASGYCISPHKSNFILFVSQQEVAFKAPYFITMFQMSDGEVEEFTHPLALRFVLEKPFLTSNDKYLIVLTAHEYHESRDEYETPTICTFSMDEEMKVSYFTPDSFRDSILIDSIVDMQPCFDNPYTIAVMYRSKEILDYNDNSPFGGLGGGARYGFMILDICSGSVVTICDPFLVPSFKLKRKLLFDESYSFCLDDQSNVFDLREGCYIGQLPKQNSPPRVIALNGTVVIYYDRSVLSAYRLSSGEIIAHCDVHSNICCLKLSRDQRTLVVGCEDGSIASYVLIDPRVEDPDTVLEHLGSRQLTEPKIVSGRRSSIPWDKVEEGGSAPQSRPVSAIATDKTDKIILKEIEPAPAFRPSSDTLMYLSTKSKACSIM